MRIVLQLALTATLAFTGLRAQCTLFVALGGSDANPGTQAAPLATPARALQVATPGSVVCLRSGSYPIAADLVVLTPLTLQSYPGEQAVLSGVPGSSVGNIIVIFVGNVTLQDLEITGAPWYGIFVTSYYTGQPPANVHIRRSKIHDVGRIGIKAFEADSIVIEDSEVFATGLVDPRVAEGINIMASIPAVGDPLNQGATVRRNYLHDVAGFGVYMKAGTTRGVIERNRVQRAGAGGIILGGDSGAIYMRNGVAYECIDCIARNNVVSDTQTLGLSCWAASNSRFYNNTAVNVAQFIQAAFFGVPNSAGTGCTNVTVENNVFVMSSANRMIHLVNPGPGVYFNYNSYYNPTGDYKFWLESPAQTGYWNFSGWRTNTINDANSTSAKDPVLDASNGYKPGPGSPLIDAGTTLAEVLDDFVGTKRPQGRAYDIGGYEVQAGPTADSVTGIIPGSLHQMLTLNYSSANGFGYLNYAIALMSSSFSGTNECGVVYYSVTGGLYLSADGVSPTQGPITPGSASILTNAECTLNAAASSVSGSGNTLIVVADVTFKPAFGPAQNIYMDTKDNGGLDSGYQWRGTTAGYPNTPPTADTVTGTASNSSNQILTFTFSSPNGYAYLNDVYALLNSSLNGVRACAVVYDKAAKAFYIVNDLGTGTTGPLFVGSSGTLANSQCALNGTGTSVSGSGNTLTMVLNLTFIASFGGAQNIFMYALDGGGLNSGWQGKGNTAGNAAPTSDSVTGMANGSAHQTLTFAYSSANGFANLSDVYMLINSAFGLANACAAYWDKGSNNFYILNDAGTSILGPMTPPSLANSQCTVNSAGTTEIGSGKSVLMTLSLTFKPGFTGVKQIFMYAADAMGTTSVWVSKGTVILP